MRTRLLLAASSWDRSRTDMILLYSQNNLSNAPRILPRACDCSYFCEHEANEWLQTRRRAINIILLSLIRQTRLRKSGRHGKDRLGTATSPTAQLRI